jgi:hypothetical protein
MAFNEEYGKQCCDVLSERVHEAVLAERREAKDV